MWQQKRAAAAAATAITTLRHSAMTRRPSLIKMFMYDVIFLCRSAPFSHTIIPHPRLRFVVGIFASHLRFFFIFTDVFFLLVVD